ncbi:MAG: aminotransferase class I/II-fold pyridoxal phosphate-dependent enzyme [Candidatus Eremiobacteraeota bacterium]|nr:aminotransferase class I/II-fold pyridoxal phosphate-dependent enzyme [Candidatus Eremiobacteraeota bacterium]
MTYTDRAHAILESIAAQHRLRAVLPDAPKFTIDFSTNDYLGLSTDSRVVEALRRAKRAGSGGARLLGGRDRDHWLLEEELARFVRRDRALIFSSGYLAAMGAIASLAQTVNAAYSDELNHACIIDGLRLIKLARHIYTHRTLPPKSGRTNGALIVSETIFSMDGDRCDVDGIVADLNSGDVLLLDEAHALGVAGPQGRGLASHVRDERVVVMGTLSKAFGSQGGFIAGPATVIELLVNTARTFIFDTALAPPLAVAARVGLYIAASADDRRERLARNAALLSAGLSQMGLPSCHLGPIVPVLAGTDDAAKTLEANLLEQHIYAPAVRPPTVPPGTSRLRLSVRADHKEAQIEQFLHALEQLRPA